MQENELCSYKYIYHALLCIVLPLLNLWSVVWGNTYESRLIAILNRQKKILRLLTFSSYREQYLINIKSSTSVSNQWLLIFQHHDNSLPHSFENYFIINKNRHSYNTINFKNICQDRNKTSHGVYSLKSRGGKLWNKLPDNLKSSQNSLSAFKNNWKYA